MVPAARPPMESSAKMYRRVIRSRGVIAGTVGSAACFIGKCAGTGAWLAACGADAPDGCTALEHAAVPISAARDKYDNLFIGSFHGLVGRTCKNSNRSSHRHSTGAVRNAPFGDRW